MQNVIDSLEQNLKELYRKALDADQTIDELKKQGHGKFANIFKDDSLFTAKANKFMPYLEETAEQILKLKDSDTSPEQNKSELEAVVKKLHLLHSTLSEFKQAVK